MADRILVYNNNKFNVGVVTLDGVNLNIPAGSFIKLSEDDINYIQSVSNLFSRGIITVDESAKEVKETIFVPDELKDNFMSDEDIRKKMSGNLKGMQKWIDSIADKVLLDRIYDVAMSMDLVASKVAILKEKMPERDF